MTELIDYDADIARRLDARLAEYVPLGHIAATPRSSHPLRLAAVAAFSAVFLSAAGIGYEANAYAETQGLSCLDAITKVQIYARTIADQFRGATTEELQAARPKQQLYDYANSLMRSAGCATGQDWRPHPSPSGRP
jgi:hypothetical protein